MFGAKLLLKHSSFGVDDALTLKSRGRFYEILLNYFDGFVAPAPAFILPQLGLVPPFYLIPNGVDTNRFHPLRDGIQHSRQRRELDISVGAFVVLGVGHFSTEKRLADIIEAVMMIPDKVKPISIVLIGSRDLTRFEVSRALLSKVESLKVRAKSFLDIKFIEVTSSIEKYMQVANVYVLSSEREGMPNSLLEAMACGVPVISSILPNITNWIIRDGTDGFLYEPGDICELTTRINHIYRFEEKSTLVGRAGRERILTMFSARATVEAYRFLYESLASKSAGAR